MEILDLTIPLDEDTKVQSEDTGYSDPLTRFEPWVEFQHKGYRVTKIEMGAHAGTHCDVPYHFLEEGKSTSDYSLEQWIGWAVVMDFRGKGPISVEMLLPFKSRIADKNTVIPVMRHNFTDYLTDAARKELIDWQPQAIVMGEGINIDERFAESTELLMGGVPMIMNADHQMIAEVRDGDLIIAAHLKVSKLEAAPSRLLAIRGLKDAASGEHSYIPESDRHTYERRIADLERLVGRLTIELEAAKKANASQ